MKKLIISLLFIASCLNTNVKQQAMKTVETKANNSCIKEQDIVKLFGNRQEWRVEAANILSLNNEYAIMLIELVHQVPTSNLVKIQIMLKKHLKLGKTSLTRSVLFYKDRAFVYSRVNDEDECFYILEKKLN